VKVVCFYRLANAIIAVVFLGEKIRAQDLFGKLCIIIWVYITKSCHIQNYEGVFNQP
jgi:drug/metabolite transporter (DMT)-like permease